MNGPVPAKLFVIAIALGLAVTTLCGAEENPVIAEFTNVTAGHYQVLAQSGLERAGQVNRFMNELLKQYSKFFANWTPKAGARVVVFSTKEDFVAYSAGKMRLSPEGLAGYCQLKTDEDGNTFYELATYDHENLWQVLAHEGFHQFLGYELGLEIPTWLNEGLAQYFETSAVKYGRLQTGLIAAPKLQAAQALIRRDGAAVLGDVLQMNRPTFYANAPVAYPLSWALVYYLLHREGDTYRSSTFRRYLQDLKKNRDSIQSFQRRFGDLGRQWQHDFDRYILRMQPSESP